jgi:hypothetical protein
LGQHRLSFGLWNDEELVRVGPDGAADAALFKEHLEYAVTVANMNTINLGRGGVGISIFPEPGSGTVQDPVQLYLHDLHAWLQARGWLDRAYIEAMPLPGRDAWQEARHAYFRAQRADRDIKRLIVGGLHPYLERYTDIWAVPLRECHPLALAQLQKGRSLGVPLVHPARAVSASSGETSPDDAYDGSLVTWWRSAASPSPTRPEWFRVDFERPVTADTFRVGFEPGYESRNIRLWTSPDGDHFTISNVRWEHHPSPVLLEPSWSEGRLKYEKTFMSVRLEFREGSYGNPVGIVEIEPGGTPGLGAPPAAEIKPIEFWLYTQEGDFPSFCVDAHAAEARVAAWVCWGHSLQGLFHGGLNDWPAEWAEARPRNPTMWTSDRLGHEFLFYPGPKGPIPSIRVENIRDGLEDYEYLAAIEKAVRSGAVAEPDTAMLCARRRYSPDLLSENVEQLSKQMLETRVKIGRALDRLAKKVKK